MKQDGRHLRAASLDGGGAGRRRSAAAGFLHDAVASMEDAFFVVDRQWRYVYVNPAGCVLLGRELEDLLGRTQWEVNPGLLGTVFEDEYLRAMSERRTVRFQAEYEPLGKSFKIHAYPSGENLAVIARDVTAQKRTQDALIASEARHRAILQAVPDLMLWVGSDGWVLNAELNATHPLCHSCAVTDREGVVTCHLDSIFPGELSRHVHAAVGRVIDGAMPEQMDFQIPFQGGEARAFEARMVPIDADAALMVVQDVTDRRRLEFEVLRISEEVHQDIGRDLHDGLSSHLTGVAMLARRLARGVRGGTPAAAESIDELADLIADGNEQARALARGLNPVVVEREGLCAALAALARSMDSPGGPRCTMASQPATGAGDGESAGCPGGMPPLDVHVATHLYRMAQEAVHNAIRHSGAGEVRICVARSGDSLQLSVSDDGCGFDPSAQTGMGLRVMRYRARLIGASLSLTPLPGGGTIVTCELPFTADNVIQPVEHSHAVPNLRCG